MAICLPQVIHLLCSLTSSPMYTIHSVTRYIYGLPLVDGDVTHADMGNFT